jgi:multiple sugar transport system permease protein/sn-glycerol 3-phosphate transport system permease protein
MDKLRENWIGYVFIIPTFLMFGLLFYFPMLRGLYVTLTNTGLGGTGGEFVGLANYTWLLSNDLFWFALGWTIVFVLGTTALQLTVGLIVALLLNELAGRSKALLTALLFSPYFSAPLAGGVIWFWFLNGDFGLVDRVLVDLGISPPAFLAEGLWPYVSLIVAQTWHDYAYAGIIYAVPKAQYEAAAMDGAGRLRRFRDVTLPHLLIPTVVILALRTAWNIAEFAQPFELTAGGPGTRTMLLSILTYRVAFVNLQFGRAFTVGVAMIVLSMTAAIIYVTAIKQEENLYV